MPCKCCHKKSRPLPKPLFEQGGRYTSCGQEYICARVDYVDDKAFTLINLGDGHYYNQPCSLPQLNALHAGAFKRLL